MKPDPRFSQAWTLVSALLSGRLKSLPSDGTSPTVWWMGNNGYMNHKKERFNYCNYTVDI
jgi:hypothetical protein